MTSKVKDYYGMLGIDQSADEKEIKHAYTSATKTNGDTKELKEAYKVLTDPKLRAQYDGHLQKERPQTSGLKKIAKASTKDTSTQEAVSAASNGHHPTQMWQYLTLESHHNYGTTKYYIDGDMQPDWKNAQFSVVVNTLGADGWELVGIASSAEEKTFVFKRPTAEKYQPPKKGPAA